MAGFTTISQFLLAVTAARVARVVAWVQNARVGVARDVRRDNDVIGHLRAVRETSRSMSRNIAHFVNFLVFFLDLPLCHLDNIDMPSHVTVFKE